MNNTTARTKTLAIVAVFMATTLVVGVLATATTQATTAFAYPQKKKGDENSRNGNTITIQKCKQLASESGWDNNQAQECENLICTHPSENATCTQEGARAVPKPTPVKLTCEQCFTTILNSKQKTDFETRFGTFADTCAIFVDPAEGHHQKIISDHSFRI